MINNHGIRITAMLSPVKIKPKSVEKFRPIIGDEDTDRLIEFGRAVAAGLKGRTVWNINSTAAGGGVAEMLQTLLPYGCGTGIDTRWLVASGDPEFFRITKRIHNGIHGSVGDGGPLGPAEHAHYRRICEQNAQDLLEHTKSGDIVILHDPQTAGLVETLRTGDRIVIWRCHIGLDQRNDVADKTWGFLRPYLEDAHAYVFSRKLYAPDWLDEQRLEIISPSIDPFSPKNNQMNDETASSILAHAGIIALDSSQTPPTFMRSDGSLGRIKHMADIIRSGPPPSVTTPIVCQVSRWDKLKDMKGVLNGFAQFVDTTQNAHLALVGPIVSGVADDPEQVAIFEETAAAWRELPYAARSRIQLVCLPMDDIEENAAIVNALQRHAKVVIQKSLEEGFGLTVSEAMWKSTPMVGSAVGGIRDQIQHGVNGLLVQDPDNLEEFGNAVSRLLDDRPQAETMGIEAKESVRKDFLASRHLEQYGELLVSLAHRLG
jgi:trehalose synthase